MYFERERERERERSISSGVTQLSSELPLTGEGSKKGVSLLISRRFFGSFRVLIRAPLLLFRSPHAIRVASCGPGPGEARHPLPLDSGGVWCVSSCGAADISKNSVVQSRPFDLLVFPFWSIFRGPKRLTFYLQVLWASEKMIGVRWVRSTTFAQKK